MTLTVLLWTNNTFTRDLRELRRAELRNVIHTLTAVKIKQTKKKNIHL